MERRKNISHLMTSEALLPGPSYSISTPTTLGAQRSQGSLIKSVCSDCINTQQIHARKQKKQSEFTQDCIRVKEMQAQDQRRKIEQQEKKQAAKNQLSVDLRGLIESQQNQRKSVIEKQRRENQNIKGYYENQQRRAREMEEHRNRSLSAIKMELKNGLEQQIQEKSRQKVKHTTNASQSRTSVPSLIPDKRQYRATQQNYHQELDLLAKRKQQEQAEKKKSQIEKERKRLRDISQKENEKESKVFEQMKIKIVKERQTMYQNTQLAQQKKSDSKKQREYEKQQFNISQQRIKPEKQNKVCIQLRDAMIKASNDKQSQRQRNKSNNSDIIQISATQPIQFTPPFLQKACCEGCHKQKSISSFGNFVL